MDLVQKNREMLLAGKYNISDTRQLSRIASLKEPNDYDLYLIACALCNYDIPEIVEVQDLRMKYFTITKNSGLDYSHVPSDYGNIETKLKCTNTGRINNYGLYEYEINVNDRDLVSDLWEYKSRDCLKYVDNKNADKIVISISKNQLQNFQNMLDKLNISYNKKNLEEGIIYTNKSTQKLIDINRLSPPWEPKDYQIEDATAILKTKRKLIGHEMGCIFGDAIVSIKENNNYQNITLAELFNKFNENSNIYIESFDINQFKYMKIKNVLDKGKQKVLQIKTTNNSLICTFDHEILTMRGWVEAQNLTTNDLVYVKNENTNCEKVIEITKLNEEKTVYDVVIDSLDVHNFVANNIVVHNCGKTFISILVGESIGDSKNVTYHTTDNLNYDDIVITDKGPLPIGKIVEENIDCKVKVIKNGKETFVNILDRKCIEEDDL